MQCGKQGVSALASGPRTVSGRPVPPFLEGIHRLHFLLHILQPESESTTFRTVPWTKMNALRPGGGGQGGVSHTHLFSSHPQCFCQHSNWRAKGWGACTELWTKAPTSIQSSMAKQVSLCSMNYSASNGCSQLFTIWCSFDFNHPTATVLLLLLFLKDR